MTRRFLTAADVRREGGPEILVDATTVVTPQALQAADVAGITIRSGEGLWQPPDPDRGPDAERSVRSLPHLPEPEDNPQLASSAIVTAVGKNRSGVLAEITAAIAEVGGNVHDVSQKVFEGYFHVIFTVEMSAGCSFGDLKTRLECLGDPEDFAVSVMNERLFRFMHRV